MSHQDIVQTFAFLDWVDESIGYTAMVNDIDPRLFLQLFSPAEDPSWPSEHWTQQSALVAL